MNIEDLQKKHSPKFRALMKELEHDLNLYLQEHAPRRLEVTTVAEMAERRDATGVAEVLLTEACIQITISL